MISRRRISARPRFVRSKARQPFSTRPSRSLRRKRMLSPTNRCSRSPGAGVITGVNGCIFSPPEEQKPPLLESISLLEAAGVARPDSPSLKNHRQFLGQSQSHPPSGALHYISVLV